MRRWVLALVFPILFGGCDKLFPELYGGPPPDAGPVDNDGGPPAPAPHIAGRVCVLSDARDYRSCVGSAATVFRISVEETRDTVMTDGNGQFVLPTSMTLSVATLAAVDPQNQFVPTVTQLQVTNGIADPIVLPVLAAQSEQQMALLNGFALDPARGAVLVWAVDGKGVPVAGVAAGQPGTGSGPFYDGPSPNEIQSASGTRAGGLVAVFDLPAPSVQLALTPPAGSGFMSDRYPLPIRPGALTLSVVVLH